MKVIIAGSRSITDYSFVSEIIQDEEDITEIVSGMARGVDRLAWAYGKANNIPVAEFPADWNRYGRIAGYYRNRDMAEYADKLIAIWDGESKGTKNMIEVMKKKGKPVKVISVT